MGGPLKAEEICEIFRRMPVSQKDYPVLIETGTWRGETIRNVLTLFEVIHSIEIEPQLFSKLKEKGFPSSVSLHLGDSSLLLTKLIPQIDCASIFFLDAHWCCLNTGRGSKDVPLIEELQAILDFQTRPAIIIIDDVRLFGLGKESNPPYPVEWGDISAASILEQVSHRLTEWFYLADRIVMVIAPINRV